MLNKVLIANRGEIALRVLRTCREMGIQTVAVHSTADAAAMHVRLADESVCIGPPAVDESYLNKASILSAIEITGADAVHPGYGFLSENADFAEMIEEHGITFIGPTAEHIRAMGDKIQAKLEVERLGLPTVPGSEGPVQSEAEAQRCAREIGFPVLIKAVSGGGGRGMTVVWSAADLQDAVRLARSEARSGFGDDRVYIEKYLDHPRHIEVQVFGDGQGRGIHLGERDCTLQRRHQKLVEEAPANLVDPAIRRELNDRVAAAIAAMGYRGAGTVEFLYQDNAFYFIEMNTRLQVEHPVTEAVTGLDLVKLQLQIAAGAPLTLTQDEIQIKGHAIECRITAEDPETLVPRAGRVDAYHPPGGLGVRVDSALYTGAMVPPYYDSLIAKVIVHSDGRDDALARMQRCLKEYVIDGIPTTIPLLADVLDTNDVRRNRYDTGWLGRHLAARSRPTRGG
ncbi:MAG: acetyl-CoA carboxylase biotin carboxylase subunit [Geminicoccaceae bacterium]